MKTTQVKCTMWQSVFLIFLILIAFCDCIPVDVVYVGEGCECPKKLGYNVNIPKPPKPRKYSAGEYGYKVDVPPEMQTKAKVSYSFDFTVEEPRIPKPPKYNDWNVYAKIDRIAVNKGDCEMPGNYGKQCKCGQCGITKPPYRYVYQKIQPSTAKCNCTNCKCKLKQQALNISPNALKFISVLNPMPTNSLSDNNDNNNSIRRKRDLHRAFFRRRKLDSTEPSGRFVKQYHKSLTDDNKRSLFVFDTQSVDSETQPSKRKTKKALFPLLRSKLVKRDIKGEYDLLEKERQQMDLTLPEIIQYMPETLQPNFKKEQCYFGCQAANDRKASNINSEQFSSDHTKLSTTTSDEQDSAEAAENMEEALYYHKEKSNPAKNTIKTTPSSSYTKRNAVKSDFDDSSTASIESTQTPVSVNLEKRSAFKPEYVYDHINRRFIKNNGRLGYVHSTLTVPDPLPLATDSKPLQYAGDLEIPLTPYFPKSASPASSYALGAAAPQYPTQHVSNVQLDKIISDIVYRHPDFIEATSHYGGALVDPEPWQEQETKDFLKKLIDGRLHLWFGDDAGHNHNSYFPPDYGRPYSPYSSPLTLRDGPEQY